MPPARTFVLVALCTIAPGFVAGSSTPSVGVRIAFSRGRSVYVMNADATGVRRLTPEPTGTYADVYYHPVWSPDGTRIAVTHTSFSPHRRDVVDVLRSDGSARRSVSDGGRYDIEPTWSPDGSRIAYSDFESGQLYLIELSSGRTRPVEVRPPDADEREPAWSPVGAEIAFARGRNGAGYRLYIVRPDGTALRRLTSTYARNPDWSPDGTRIAYDDGRNLVVIRASGQGGRVLGFGVDPAWSRDGKRLLVVRDENIWVMDADGGNPQLLARNARQPDWQPLLR